MGNDSMMNSISGETYLNLIFPYRVYEVISDNSPDCKGPLMMIRAGFTEKEDADIYAGRKYSITGKKHIVKDVSKE